MKIFKALQIGHYHQNNCEDYLFTGTIGKDKLVCAVMDGCTNATDSYFISTLVGKLLRKITIGKGYEELYNSEHFTTSEDYLKSILKDLFSELKSVRNLLLLNPKELLTTLILLFIDKNKNEGIVLVIGDGLVSINGKVTEFDQDNTPDYIGFHLDGDFENWYSSQKQKIIFNVIDDISIATDGIFSFTQVTRTAIDEKPDVLDFLLINRENNEKEEMLALKLKKLEHSYGLVPTDDFAMIRILSNN
jgi:hypothetical protein